MPDTELDDLEAELAGASSPEKQKRLSPAEWEQVKLYWEMGTHSLSQLADEFGIRADTIQKRLKADGIEKGARAHEVASATRESAKNELAEQAAENLKRVHSTKDDHYKWAEALAKLLMSEIVDAKQTGTAIGARDANITTLGKAAKTLEVLRKERYAILNLNKDDGDPDEMPELIISELNEEQIRDIQDAMRGVSVEDSLDISALESTGVVSEGEDSVD